jgi:XTP/dITP diphosphohydrolase
MAETLVFATRNRGKLAELGALVAPLGFVVRALDEFGGADVVEDAPTFEGNADKKARAALALTGLPSLADDSGLEVDALDGAPGVRSARFAAVGDEAGHDDGANNRLLLEKLRGVERRSARFRCVLVYLRPDGTRRVAEGRCEGSILMAPRGDGGFGYDPLFLVEGTGQSMAELPMEEKNRVSHRARAFASLMAQLR